jgi:hypothetical protein
MHGHATRPSPVIFWFWRSRKIAEIDDSATGWHHHISNGEDSLLVNDQYSIDARYR